MRLSGATREIGVVSDLDSTVIPPHDDKLPERPYPGVAALYRELEFKDRGRPGDVRYVTARAPDRVTKVPAWLERHNVPAGPILTGRGTAPKTAHAEKLRDIRELLRQNHDQRFVLFGDSSHVDPDVYRTICAEFKAQVVVAFIHNVEKIEKSRVRGLTLVDNYAEAAAELMHRGVLDEAAARRVMRAAKNEGLEISNAEIEQLLRR